MAYPPYPPLERSLRLATAADIDRIAPLSVAGFKDSEIFCFLRPHHHHFPQDAVDSFANLYRAQLQDARAVVIVAQDWCYHNNHNHQRPNQEPSSPSSSLVVVGVASWILPQGSPRTGQFIVPDEDEAGEKERPALLNRDLCPRRLELFTRVTKASEEKYFKGRAVVCDKLVVHPSYRRRGHATAMLRWGLSLCDLDKFDQGVIPSHMGEPLYLSLGYDIIGEMEVPDDGEVKGFTQRVVLYTSRQRNNS